MTNTALSWLDYGLSKLGIENDPAPAWKFYVEILGVIVGEFTAVSGLSVTREFERIKEGGTNDFQHVLPGKLSHGDVTLSRGITYSRELWRWFSTGALDGQVLGWHSFMGVAAGLAKLAGRSKKYTVPKKPSRIPRGTNMSIILGNSMGMKVKHWDLIGAVPIKWTGPDFKTDSTSMAIEQLTIAYHRVDLSIWAMTPMGGLTAMIDSGIKTGLSGGSGKDWVAQNSGANAYQGNRPQQDVNPAQSAPALAPPTINPGNPTPASAPPTTNPGNPTPPSASPTNPAPVR